MRIAVILAPLALLAPTACGRSTSAPVTAPATATAASTASEPAPAATTAPTAYCYVFHRDAPAGNFSNCYDREGRCRETVASRRAVFEEQGGRLERDCEVSPEATCAVALDDAGRVTFRSCAATAAICEEQRTRAARMTQANFVGGASRRCRSATRDDLAHDPASRAPGALQF